jgi:hypothetical protein
MSYIRDLARRISRTDSSVRVPRSPSTSLHQGVLTAVDVGTNTVEFEHNGTGTSIPGVRYLVAYTADNPPKPGDVVWMQLHGTDPMILGRHVVPNSTVSF